ALFCTFRSMPAELESFSPFGPTPVTADRSEVVPVTVAFVAYVNDREPPGASENGGGAREPPVIVTAEPVARSGSPENLMSVTASSPALTVTLTSGVSPGASSVGAPPRVSETFSDGVFSFSGGFGGAADRIVAVRLTSVNRPSAVDLAS